jgi:hypothetical protein
MKSLIILVLFSTIMTFPQGNYEARISILRIYWQNDDEWGAILQSNLYLNGSLLIPNVDYDPSDNLYTWKRLENGVYVIKSHQPYYLNTDGENNQVWTWKVQVSGPGFSTNDSDPKYVVKYGDIARVNNVNAFKNDGSSANSDIWIRIWGEYSWYDRQPGPNRPFFLTDNAYNVLKDSIVSLNEESFHRWTAINPTANYYNNHASIYVGDGLNDLNVYHKIQKSVSFNGSNEIPNLKFLLEDPWYVNTEDPNYYQAPYGYRNLGLNSIPTEVNNGTYNRIFLNQPYTGSHPINYSISIPSNVYIPQTGKYHDIYLIKWVADPLSDATFEHPNSSPSGVVFKNEGVTITANVKGQGLSSDQNTFSNNSQKKIVRVSGFGSTPTLHKVYQDMGYAWYETSTDNGQNWVLKNGAQALGFGGGKNPTIDWVKINSSGAVYAVVVYQYPFPSPGHGYQIFVNIYGNETFDYPLDLPLLQQAEIYSEPSSSTFDANPTIAITPYTNYASLDIVWQSLSGLYFYQAYLNTNPNHNPVMTHAAGPTLIPNTTVNSINPSIAISNSNSNGIFSLVWEESNSIKYTTINGTTFSTIQSISTGDGFSGNANPSLVVLNDGNARVCWRGSYCYFQQDTVIETQNPFCRSKVVVVNTEYPRYFHIFGNNTGTPNINKADDDSYVAIAWSQDNGASTYFADNANVIREINMPGKYIQVSNGPSMDQMYAEVFNTETSPYFFSTSPSLGSYYTPHKITSYAFS